MTDDVNANFTGTPESKRYVVGPTIEVSLPWNFAFEFDALYHRVGYSVSHFLDGLGGFIEGDRDNSWEFPMMLKYKLPFSKIKPFAEIGLAPRTISGTARGIGTNFNIDTGQTTTANYTFSRDWGASLGVVVGGGAQFEIGRLRLSPELRYTHWTSTPINMPIPDGAAISSTQDQVDVLVGIGWVIHRPSGH